MVSPNLAIAHVGAAQNNKETTVNAAVDALDNAMNSILDKVTDATTDVLLSDLEFRSYSIFRLTGTTGTETPLFIPAGIIKHFTVYNQTDAVVSIETEDATSLAIELAAGAIASYHSDGSEITLISVGAAASSFDIGMYIQGVPTTEELVFRYKVVTPFSIPAGATGSLADAAVTSTGAVAFSLEKNGTPFGNILFNASATGVFTVLVETSFVAGDVFSIFSDEYGDADTLANISITFKGIRL